MSRRKHLLARGSTGRLLRHDAGNTALLSPTEARRLFDAASAGLRDPVWATVLGRLYRDGKINSAQFAAASVGRSWSRTIRSPAARPAAAITIAGRHPRYAD